MRQNVHAWLGFDVDAAFWCCIFSEFIFDYDFVRDVTQFHPNEFRLVQRCHEVKVGDVHCHEVCAFCGDDAVEEHLGLGHKHFHGGGGDFAQIIDSISSNSESCSIRFTLFWSYVPFLLLRYLILVNELYGIGGVLHSAADAIC